MANDIRAGNAAVNAAVDALTALLNGGKLQIYAGTRPATGDTAISGQTLLAELTFGNPAFGAASGGVATANAITADSSANATGTATWFRLLKSDDTKVLDGEIGTSGADLNLNTTSLVAGAEVGVTSMTLTLPKS